MSHGYKVGDRVISLYGPEMFAKATVCYVDESTLSDYGIGTAFDKPVGVHDCEGHCEEGHGYWVSESDLIPELSKKASEREYIKF